MRIQKIGLPILICWLLLVGSIPSTIYGQQEPKDTCEGTLFSLNLLIPDNDPVRISWSQEVISALTTLCIDVSETLPLSWDEFASRTTHYLPPDSPDTQNIQNFTIPLHDAGGYDLALLDVPVQSQAPSMDLTSFYQSNATLVHAGANIYQYDSYIFDEINAAYTSELDTANRIRWAYTLQRILYLDLPAITLYYPVLIYAFNPSFNYTDSAYLQLLYTGTLGDRWFDFGIDGEPVLWAHPYQQTDYSPLRQDQQLAKVYQDAIWQGLFQRNPDTLWYEPLLATSMPGISANNRDFYVEMNQSIFFADRTPVNSTDVYDSFLRNLNPAYNSSRRDILVKYFGDPFSDPSDPKYRVVSDIISIEGPYTLKFSTLQPYFDIYRLLSFPVLPTHIWGHYNQPIKGRGDFDTHGAIYANCSLYGFGTGPFQYFTVDELGSRVRLLEVPQYWNRNGTYPASSGFDFILYRNVDGAIHELQRDEVDALDPAYHTSIEGIETLVHLIPDFSWQELAINQQHPVIGTGADTPLGLADPTRASEAARYVRQAISHAIPRTQIINGYLKGMGVPGITPWAPAYADFDAKNIAYEYNLQTAQELLQQAGYDISVQEPVASIDTPYSPHTSTEETHYTFPADVHFELETWILPVLFYGAWRTKTKNTA